MSCQCCGGLRTALNSFGEIVDCAECCSDQDPIVARDRMEQTHPARAAQSAHAPEEHTVAASFHEKRAAELHAAHASTCGPECPAARAHEIASGVHRVAVSRATDADSLAARTASAHAVETELAETGSVQASVVATDVQTCGDVAGHEFHGNQFEPSISDLAQRASERAKSEGTSEAHAHAAAIHREAHSEHLKQDAETAAAGLLDTGHRLMAEHHKIAAEFHANEAKQLKASGK